MVAYDYDFVIENIFIRINVGNIRGDCVIVHDEISYLRNRAFLILFGISENEFLSMFAKCQILLGMLDCLIKA